MPRIESQLKGQEPEDDAPDRGKRFANPAFAPQWD
jgi:hypothetical protein